MKFLYRGAIVSCGLLLAATVSHAADMRLAPAAPVAAAYGSPAYDWSGFYAGVFAGGSHGVWSSDLYRNNNHGHSEQGADGAAFGVFGGYNYQFANRFVIGAEADFGKSSAQVSNEIYDNDSSLAKYGAFGSVRGRVGYAFDRALLFATAGVGFANISNDIQKGRNAGEQVVWDDQVRAGLAVGGGIEYAFTDHLFGRGEYTYTDYGNVTLYNRDGNRADFKNEMHTVRAGLGYKF
jgi:outer membrane immunogenic protein